MKVIYTPPIPCHTPFSLLAPTAKFFVHLGIIAMYDHKNTIVMEMIFSKCEEIIHVELTTAVPHRDIGGGARNSGHMEVLWNICKDEVDARVGLGLPCVGARAAASNLERKIIIIKQGRGTLVENKLEQCKRR